MKFGFFHKKRVMRIQKLTKNTLGVTRKVFKGIILLVILSKLSRKEKKWFGRLGCENNVQIFWRVDKTGAAKRRRGAADPR